MASERYTVGLLKRPFGLNDWFVWEDGNPWLCCGRDGKSVAEKVATALNRESAVSELLAALRPFADAAGFINTTVPDECDVNFIVSEYLPTVGDCRRAAEAVQKWESGR